MTRAGVILNNKYSVEDIKQALLYVLEDYNIMLKKLLEEVSIKDTILGVNLSNVFSVKIENNIELVGDNLLGNTYKILNEFLTVKTSDIIVKDSDIKKISDFKQTLNDSFAKHSMIFTEVQEKNILNTNLLSVKDLEFTEGFSVLNKNNTEVNVNKCEIKYSDLSDSNSLISIETFKDMFFTKKEFFKSISLSITNLSSLTVNNSIYKELLLDYTTKEIEGSGVKISDFIEEQAAQEAQKAILEVFITTLFPGVENKLKINGNEYSYKPSNDDTTDIVADSIGDAIDIDGVTYKTEAGFYSNTPKDDDDEYKIGFYLKDTTSDLDVSVSLESDNDDEHDLLVDWDDDGKTLTVTYASDGSDTMYPTIGELIDAIQDNSPIKVVITDSSYTRDDDYPYEMDFKLKQNDSKLIIYSEKEDINVEDSSPSDAFSINKVQDYQDGKHQKGEVQVVKFRRGYSYQIKISDTEYNIDCKEDNNSDINNEFDLVEHFVSLINEEDQATASKDADKIKITLKDYEEHEITTSGEEDYSEPLDRDVVIKYDLRNFVEQGDETVLIKNGINIKSKIPISKKELSILVDNGIFFNKQNISDVKLKENINDYKFRSNSDNDVSTLFESVEELFSMYNFDKTIFMQKKLEYIGVNDVYINANLNFPNESTVDKYKIFTSPKTEILHFNQLKYFFEASIDTIQKTFLSFDDVFYSIMQNTFSNYINNKNISSISKLVNIKNDDRKSYFKFTSLNKPNIVNTSLYGSIGGTVVIKYNDNKKRKLPYKVFYSAQDIYIETTHEGTKTLYFFYVNDDIIKQFENENTKVKVINKLLRDPKTIKEIKNFEFKKIGNNDYEEELSLYKKYTNKEVTLEDEFNSEYFLKHMLMSLILQQNAPNLLEQIVYLIETFFFDSNDVALHLNNELFRDVVMEMDTDDPEPEMTYGLDGTPEENIVSFADLYIRQYKSELKKQSSTSMSNYVSDFYKNLSTNEKVAALRLVPIKDTDNKTIYHTLLTKDKIISASNIFDDLLYSDVVNSGYFGNNVSLFNDKAFVGHSNIFNDTIWNLLIKTIFIVDEDKIEGVKDSLSLIKIIYDKFTDNDPYLFAAILSAYRPDIYEWDIESNESALFNLFIRIYEALKRNNIAEDKYEEYFNKYVGLLFVGDNSETGILPFELFKYFVSAIGEHKLIEESSDVLSDFDSKKFIFYFDGDNKEAQWKYHNNILVLEIKDN